MVPKNDKVTVEKIKAAIQAAYTQGESKLRGSGKTVPPLSAIKTPLRDGDLERPDDEKYQTKKKKKKKKKKSIYSDIQKWKKN